MSVSVASLDGVLKNFYNQKYVANLIAKESPFFSNLKKNPNGSGKKNIFPIIFGADEGLAATLLPAQAISASAGGGSLQADDWVCSWGDYVSSLAIDDKAIKASASDMGSFIDAQKESIDAHFKKWAQVLTRYLLHSKSRNLGSFTISSGVCSLVNAADIVNYSKGMILQVSANDGSSTGHALLTANLGYVIGVNYNSGTFTVSDTDGGAATTPTSWTGTMYAFRYGDFGGTAAPAVVVDGLMDWCPTTDPSATLFNGVDRTQHIMALSGVRLTTNEIAGLGLEARIRKLCTRMFGRGAGSADRIYIDPDNFLALAESLEAKGIRDPIGKDATFGFQTLHVATPGGVVPIYAERYMPYGAIYALADNAFQLDSLGPCPQYIDEDGLKMLRKTAANSYEIRLVAYPCSRAIPGYIGYVPAP